MITAYVIQRPIFETGISDHHTDHLYRSYISFNIETFKKKTVSDKLSRLENNSCSEFEKAFLTVLNKQAQLKNKILRHNKNLFMTNGLSLKHGFGGCEDGFGGYDGLGGLGGFDGFGGFSGFDGFSGLGGFVF